MRSPTLNELPPPPPGKSGWPWTTSSPQLPGSKPNGDAWPRVSIVTPNYNYDKYIEATIRSVLLQGYPDLEYIVSDGGSTDRSIDVLKKYEKWIQWESRPDKGQSNAINNSFRQTTGEILSYLNSDDFYEPGTLAQIATEIDAAQGRFVIMGDIQQICEHGKRMRIWKSRVPLFRSLIFQYRLCLIRGINVMPSQPSVFWHRQVLDRIGFLREDLTVAMDYEYWLRMLISGYRFYYVPKIFSNYRFHPKSISNQGWSMFYPEWKKISSEYFVKLHTHKKVLVELYWWSVLLPVSLITFPYRALSYLLGVKRG